MKDRKRLQELENTVKVIYDRADAREKAGRDPVEAGAQCCDPGWIKTLWFISSTCR